MRTWKEIAIDSLQTGAVASVATTVAIAALGKAEGTTAAAPINAISHILWGDEAATQDDLSATYTLTGLGLNTAAVGSWAALYELCFGGRRKEGVLAKALLGGAAISLLAYVVDYFVVPERLTPGFEKRLSGASLFAIYVVLALSLGLGRPLLGKGAEKKTPELSDDVA